MSTTSGDGDTAERITAVQRIQRVSGRVYTDPDIFDAECRDVFDNSWRLVCHESELPEPYDYRTFEHVGRNCFVIRGPDGQLRSFLNACSHRGARLLDAPAGNAERIRCFYHLWAYDALGHCVTIPRPEAYENSGIEQSSLGLKALRTATHLGLVFVNMDGQAEELENYLSGALDGFAGIMDTKPLEVFHYSRAELDCNWKAWHETNMDIYHELMHVVLRRTQLNAMPMEARSLVVYGNGHGGSGKLQASYDDYAGFSGRGSDVAPLPDTAPNDFRFTALFPNSVVLSRGTVMRLDTVTPLGPNRALLEMRGLGLRGESEEDRRIRERHHNQYWGPFGRNVPEDMYAAEACAVSYRGATAKEQIIARDEGMSGQDDGLMRAFYGEWSRRVGRNADDLEPCR
jgi:methanesulfonate monooxygenase large subunit